MSDPLYKIQSNAYILRLIVYSSAIYYDNMNILTGWPPAIMNAILLLLKSTAFISSIPENATFSITIISFVLTILTTLWSTIHVSLGYSEKMEKCKGTADNLYNLIEDIRVKKAALDALPNNNELLLSIATFSGKLKSYQKSLDLIPKKVFAQYYPNDPKQIEQLFDLYENPPNQISIARSIALI